MTSLSALILGLLMIGTILMSIGGSRVLRGQRQTGEKWISSKPLQLSSALVIHGAAAVPAFLATLIAVDKPSGGIVLYCLWFTWVGWLIAKTIIIWVTGYIRFAWPLYSLWVLVWVALRLTPAAAALTLG